MIVGRRTCGRVAVYFSGLLIDGGFKHQMGRGNKQSSEVEQVGLMGKMNLRFFRAS